MRRIRQAADYERKKRLIAETTATAALEARSVVRLVVLQETIANYRQHADEASYLAAVFTRAGSAAVVDCICKMIRTGTPDDVVNATFFTLDAGRHYLLPHDVTDAFRDALVASDFFPAMGAALDREVYHTRSEVIHTLGRLCLPEGAALLRKAFPRFLVRDPLLLPELLFELSRLDGRRDWSVIEQAADNEDHFVRWSIMPLLGLQFCDRTTPDYAAAARLVERLSHDVSPLVRAEAAQAHGLFQLNDATLDRITLRKRRRALYRQGASIPTFFSFKLLFWQDRTEVDYTTDDLEKFAAELLTIASK